ncbi:MAG: ATP-binding protein, partial [Bryobacteraceae bacterium]
CWNNVMNSAESHAREHAQLLAGVAADLVRFEEPEPLLASAFRRLSEKTDADLCFCYLVEGHRLHLVYTGGLSDQVLQAAEWLGFEDGLCGRAAREGCRTGSEDIQKSADPAAAFLKSIGAGAFYCYPLIAGTRILGALSFGTREATGFSAEELELQRAITGEIALALDRLLLIAELGRKEEALEIANASLRRANTDLEQFAFSASHDLREPLRHLAIYSDLLRTKAAAKLDGECHEYLIAIASSARRIEVLVRDLLAYTQAAADGSGGERAVNTGEALAQALSNLSGLIRESNASIEAAALPAVCANPLHLVQLFERIVENAIKYRCLGSPPEVHIFAREQDGGPVFCVRDSGIGIAPEYSGRVFGLFKRLHTSEEYEGTGIGLAICQKIVEHYRGEIWVESRTGEGATFCFTLGKQTDGSKSVSASAHLYR